MLPYCQYFTGIVYKIVINHNHTNDKNNNNNNINDRDINKKIQKGDKIEIVLRESMKIIKIYYQQQMV